jgi:hypothetical protein
MAMIATVTMTSMSVNPPELRIPFGVTWQLNFILFAPVMDCMLNAVKVIWQSWLTGGQIAGMNGSLLQSPFKFLLNFPLKTIYYKNNCGTIRIAPE